MAGKVTANQIQLGDSTTSPAGQGLGVTHSNSGATFYGFGNNTTTVRWIAIGC